MRLTPKRLSVWAASFVAAVLLVAGCGGPSLPHEGEAAGLSVQESLASSSASWPTENEAEEASPSIAKHAAAEPDGGGAAQASEQPQETGVAASPTSSEQPTSASSPKDKELASPLPEKGAVAVSSSASPEPTKSAEEVFAAPSPSPKPEEEKQPPQGNGEPETIKFAELYGEVGVRGMKLSDKLLRLDGRKVEMTGFMAPPLTATVHFFVLTKIALSICPFCSTDADWPADIVVVFMPEGEEIRPTEHQVRVTGKLSVGSQTDEETGFVSLIRIIADKTEVLK
ncbi:hypothetical protein [Cohnella sp. GCM10027633]|uniref:hypothetical protein n=1 Tax=unclassified Cohnella TaxID=2636738 RepID=UPI00362B7B79